MGEHHPSFIHSFDRSPLVATGAINIDNQQSSTFIVQGINDRCDDHHRRTKNVKWKLRECQLKSDRTINTTMIALLSTQVIS